MAWTTPKTWSSEPLTSLDLNTYVRDNQTYIKDALDGTARQYIEDTTDYTTTSTSYVDVDSNNMAHQLTTTGEDVLVLFVGRLTNSGTGMITTFTVDVDGTTYTEVAVETSTNNDAMNPSFAYVITGLSASSHTFTLQWKVSGGTSTLTKWGKPLFDVRRITGKVA